jgi:isocitrate dehydrogenase (NAD+)
MLRDLGETETANRVENAVFSVFKEHKYITRDLGGKATTSEYVKAVIGAMN